MLYLLISKIKALLMVVNGSPFLSVISFLLSLPVFPVTEDADYRAITGIHVGKMFDLSHSNPTNGKGARLLLQNITQGYFNLNDHKNTHI